MTTMTTSAPADPAPEIPLRPGMSPDEIFAAYGLICLPRIGTMRNPDRKTYGRAVARIAAKLGMPFMPWQRYAADVALEVDPATKALAYRDVTMLVPRQSGKTTLILSLKVHRALAFPREARRNAPRQRGRQRIIYAAQKGKDAREKFVDDHLPILQASPFASRFSVRLQSGAEALRWDTGALDTITANTESAGHSKTLDLAVEDEFWAAVDFRLEQAFSPAMITRWSPQHWRISTEGTEKSLYLAAKVDRGRAVAESGEQSSVCYLEWSNLDDSYDDPATWRSCMPALGHTVSEATIRAELEKMEREEFERAYLNRRRGSKPPPDPNIPTVEQWRALADPRAVPCDPVAFAIEVSFDRKWAAIVSVGLHPDGRRRAIEVIDHRADTDWIVSRAAELNAKWNPLAWGLAIGGPAASLVQPLADKGIKAPTGDPERGQLWIPTSRELGAACGALVDGVRNVIEVDGEKFRLLAHRDDPRLNDAVAAARTRPMGDLWMFARKGAGDITTLVAATVALAAYEARKHVAAAVSAAPATAAVPPPTGARELWRPTQRLNL